MYEAVPSVGFSVDIMIANGVGVSNVADPRHGSVFPRWGDWVKPRAHMEAAAAYARRSLGTLLAKVVSRSCLTTLLPCLLNRRDTYSRRMCTLVVYSTAVSSQLTANLAPSATTV